MERLRGRGTETEEKMAVRLANAAAEIEFGTAENFDAVVVNDELEAAVAGVRTQLAQWFPEIAGLAADA